ncbi:MAG TPA: cupin domain-containing protein [Gaiellaceae bacterium]|nr:cupin domain-containing protein [Gaiellaceae bacterium]
MDSWFAANLRDLPWATNAAMGDACLFEDEEHRFGRIGYTLAVLQPGQPGGRYHRELDNQEDFLVLAGECVAIVEGEERALRRWDFLHCPPGTEHGFVGAGAGPCVLFCAGSRTSRRIVYPRNELALRRGCGVETETRVPAEAYADTPKWEPGVPFEL